ncbi:UNKNOWN [Stylonychia lemnae]|uniref:Uncharacterized protein n=1 Tax=Stylonychia lemnae TaxID=5949 RepID=A0A077ZTR3_STYLE|nr:UNKNOWN [Stylonychia lemnae]|eukprot:CDW72934.1 UNKNOWN [Stylonychia lemnae]
MGNMNKTLYLYARRRMQKSNKLKRDQYLLIKCQAKIEDIFEKYKWEQENILVVCYAFENIFG